MKKALFAIMLLGSFLPSCHKGMIGCDPGPGGGMQKTFDVAFYRGPDMRQEVDYVSVDGGKLTLIPPAGDFNNVSCSTPGMLHYTLGFGTHTYVVQAGDSPNSGAAKITLVLSASGATINGQPQAPQSCNGGLSVVIADM